jgi:hypothetical protein
MPGVIISPERKKKVRQTRPAFSGYGFGKRGVLDKRAGLLQNALLQ